MIIEAIDVTINMYPCIANECAFHDWKWV